MIKKAVIATGIFAVSAMVAATMTFAQTATPSPSPAPTTTTTVAPTTAVSAPTAAPDTGRAE